MYSFFVFSIIAIACYMAVRDLVFNSMVPMTHALKCERWSHGLPEAFPNERLPCGMYLGSPPGHGYWRPLLNDTATFYDKYLTDSVALLYKVEQFGKQIQYQVSHADNPIADLARAMHHSMRPFHIRWRPWQMRWFDAIVFTIHNRAFAVLILNKEFVAPMDPNDLLEEVTDNILQHSDRANLLIVNLATHLDNVPQGDWFSYDR